ncbi:MAG: PaaI family thioesterase [Myxococcales bacterium]
MDATPIQDRYPDDYAHCFGCGRHNEHGHRLKTRWDGREAVARFSPKPEHVSLPGFVYGGLIASLIDCHAMATASVVLTPPGGEPTRCVTASLKVDFLRPTPLGPELELRARPKEAGAKKVVVEVRLFAAGEECARGEVVAVRLPESMRGLRQ